MPGHNRTGTNLVSIEEVLAHAQRLGFLGAGPIEPRIAHALAFGDLVLRPRRALDLGSGGGLPGLVLAATGRDTSWVLLDASVRRTRFLAEAVERLGLGDTVAVVCRRAEELGRETEHREQYGAVVARSFASPAVTAECGAPLLHHGGVLVVSDPPVDVANRWPVAGLATLGLEPGAHRASPALVSFRKVGPTDDRYPRRVGIPSKRPLWAVSRDTPARPRVPRETNVDEDSCGSCHPPTTGEGWPV